MSSSSNLLPPAHAITPDDHAGYAVIAAATCLVFVLLVLLAKLLMRWSVLVELYGDDWTAIAASICSVVQCALVLVAVSQGFGKSQKLLDPQSSSGMQKSIYASVIFYLLGLFLSRTSLLLLILRLSPEQLHIRMLQGAVGTTTAALVAAVIMIALGCNTSHPWLQVSRSCTGLSSRWIAIAVIGIVIELFTFGMVLRIYVMLQKEWRSKVKGVSTFSLRLPVIAFTTIRLVLCCRLTSSPDPMFSYVVVTCWTQAELAYSFMMAILPSLMPVMIKLDTSLGAIGPHITSGYGYGDSRTGGHQLRSTKGGQNPSSSNEIRMDNVHNLTTIFGPGSDARSISSDASTKVFVKKQVDVSYEPQSPQVGTAS